MHTLSDTIAYYYIILYYVTLQVYTCLVSPSVTSASSSSSVQPHDVLRELLIMSVIRTV
jgi:hypothetical protein